jgi:hypothetical protein
MSLNALVYRRRAALDLNVEELGTVKDDRTGEYYFLTPEHDGKFPREAFIACEFWIGNIMEVAELRQELQAILGREDSILQTKCFYSGTHSGDVIELAALPDLKNEVRELSRRHGSRLSDYLKEVLKGMLELIEAAKKENNPIVFV